MNTTHTRAHGLTVYHPATNSTVHLTAVTPAEVAAFPLTVTPRGHAFDHRQRCAYSNDFVCVHCGTEGHFDYILDYVQCVTIDTEYGG